MARYTVFFCQDTLSRNLSRRNGAIDESNPANIAGDRLIDWEAAKTRVLSVLMERAKRNEPELTNSEIRKITHYNRNQAHRLVKELIKENPAVTKSGERRWARYAFSM
jgi:ATP-dependent DNA helicase RecG